MPRLPLSEFEALPYPLLDVRAPIEFAQGHVPGALNLPLFTDEERARIGTAYKQVNQERAVHLGLEFFGPKMSAMVKQAKKLAPGKEVRLHCWRGGMRSGAVLWLLELAGFRVHLLDHGYKDYRRAVLASFAQPRQWRVLGGLTGSGKTDVLHALVAEHQQPVLDLEGLAHHKGYWAAGTTYTRAVREQPRGYPGPTAHRRAYLGGGRKPPDWPAHHPGASVRAATGCAALRARSTPRSACG
jgi:tRNA 2-selenouridine synthase